MTGESEEEAETELADGEGESARRGDGAREGTPGERREEFEEEEEALDITNEGDEEEATRGGMNGAVEERREGVGEVVAVAGGTGL